MIDGFGCLSKTAVPSGNAASAPMSRRGPDLPLVDIPVDALRLSLDINNGLVLLLDEDGHLGEHLRQLGEGPLNLLDLGVSLLHLAVCASCRAVSV